MKCDIINYRKEVKAMRKFQINVRGNGTHLFDTVSEAYHWVCENVMVQGDKDWYKECGNDVLLNEIEDERVQEVVLRNCFENVILAIWNDRADGWEKIAEIH